MIRKVLLAGASAALTVVGAGGAGRSDFEAFRRRRGFCDDGRGTVVIQGRNVIVNDDRYQMQSFSCSVATDPGLDSTVSHTRVARMTSFSAVAGPTCARGCTTAPSFSERSIPGKPSFPGGLVTGRYSGLLDQASQTACSRRSCT